MPFTGPIEDRLALRELLDMYSAAVNEVDADLWGSLWAEDSRWALPDYPEIGETVGRTAIVAMWVEAMKHYPGVVFVATPGSMSIEGDHATMCS
jgi:hypothetical protein